ncbi:histidine--tRNA ligase [Patescibacteria group bacterium]|nr:histidine--tRNA ligase [Patescibacteria group bacterium]
MAKKQKIKLHSVKGMHDTLPSEQFIWDKLRKEIKNTAEAYSFSRIDTPILENLSLFERGIGEETDIVEKQMFVLPSSGGERMVLRPEGTSAIARAYIQHGLSRVSQPLKVYQEGPFFRHENPQAGRYRQFHQAGFEIIGGENDPIYDVQIIMVVMRLLRNLKLKNLSIHINSIGCKTCRTIYKKKLLKYYKNRKKQICNDCNKRMLKNPLRLLDCKDDKCQEIKKGAPSVIDDLCSFCSKHLRDVLEYVEELKIPYQIDPSIVRGLDYYNGTVFEVFSEVKSPEGEIVLSPALGGGGRYNYLFNALGKGGTYAVGAALGLERIIETMKATGVNVPIIKKKSVFLITIGAEAKKKGIVLLEDLIKTGVNIKESMGKNSLSAQLRAADKKGATWALILGQKEVFKESIILRNLKTGSQETIFLKNVLAKIKKKL